MVVLSVSMICKLMHILCKNVIKFLGLQLGKQQNWSSLIYSLFTKDLFDNQTIKNTLFKAQMGNLKIDYKIKSIRRICTLCYFNNNLNIF
jgi:hypothetical protein